MSLGFRNIGWYEDSDDFGWLYASRAMCSATLIGVPIIRIL